MPTRGDFDVGVGDFGVVLEDAARTCECEARLKVPEGVAVEVGACICMSVKCLKKVVGARESVPASQRRRHGSLKVFHFCHIVVKGEDKGADIWSLKDRRCSNPHSISK